MVNVAILGAGHIARKMADTIRQMKCRGDKVELYAVASRSLEKAEAFAKEEGAVRAYGSYEELAADPAVDLVYIATPHSHHAENMELCLNHGKPVLSEKAFTANAAQAERVLKLAQEKRLLAAEAIWTRYMPIRAMVDEAIASGEIGTPHFLTANLGYDLQHVARLRQPELAGGALLDLGVYVLNFAAMVFGTDIEHMDGNAVKLDTGVDFQESITLRYKDGRAAVLATSAFCPTSRECWIYGDKGCMKLDNVNNPLRAEIYDSATNAVVPRRVIEAPKQLTGFEYEVSSCLRALSSGAIECPEMPHAEILRMMRWMDALRQSWGVKYPFE